MSATSIYDFQAQRIDGTDAPLKDYEGQVLLIVNTASKCGFTPQYDGLQTLHDKYAERGLKILGFPCNQFGKQEPGDASQIQEFCSLNFSVKFDMFDKVEVNGSGAHPLFKHLKSSQKGVLGTEAIKWNFTKFLVSRTGEVIGRYAPTTTPSDLEKHIEPLLG